MWSEAAHQLSRVTGEPVSAHGSSQNLAGAAATLDCRSKAQQRINLVDFDPAYEEEYTGDEIPLDRIASTTASITAMTFDEKQALIAQMSGEGEQQDFPTV